MEKLNSYDVFDTLIARICFKGHNIFEIIQNISGLKDFKSNRIRCEQKTRNVDKTYNLLSKIYGRNMDEIKRLEYQIECDFSIGIRQYLNQIRKQDICISDMYLPKQVIRDMIQRNYKGNFNNKLLVTYDGKLSGSVWNQKELVSQIHTHYGDNIRSDYNNALKVGLNAEYINWTKWNEYESQVKESNEHIAMLMRAIRLENYRENDKMNNVLVHYIIPFVINVVVYLRNRMLKRKQTTIVFLSRDGYWFHEVFKILYPDVDCHYEYFSRLLVKNNRDDVIKSLRKYDEGSLVFDLQGSGRTFQSLNLNLDYLICMISNTTNYTNYIFNTLQSKKLRCYIEIALQATHGSVEKIINGQYILKHHENNALEQLNDYIGCIKTLRKCVSMMRKYKYFDIRGYNPVWDYLLNSDWSIVKTYFNHINDHSLKHKDYPIQYTSQIGQDKFFIEQITKFSQGGKFLEIGGYDGKTGSNTYILEKLLGWDGIIVECNPNMVEKCKQIRNVYICDKAIYPESDKEVEFVVPCGKDIVGGVEQLAGIRGMFKQESLKAFKQSYEKQKIIKVKTININDLLESQNITTLQYVSLDIEGLELQILKSWDFDKYKVEYLTVEHGNIAKYQNSIRQYLQSIGFRLIRNNKWDDEYKYVGK